jgi:hypothetical protein
VAWLPSTEVVTQIDTLLMADTWAGRARLPELRRAESKLQRVSRPAALAPAW